MDFSAPLPLYPCPLGPMAPPVVTYEPRSFVINKAGTHQVTLHGTKHNQPCSLDFIISILPMLADSGITHVGLEIASDQQRAIDRFMREGTGLEDIEVFHVIDCPEYRYLLKAIRACGLSAVALDLPRSAWDTPYTRDQWMANEIGQVLRRDPRAKVFVIVGNLHTLKNIDWLDPSKTDAFIPGHLSRWRPDLGVFSMVAEHIDVEGSGNVCDFYRKLVTRPIVVETAGLDLELRVLRLLAAKPMDPCRLVDAIVVY